MKMSKITIYLSVRFSFTVGGEGAARLWGDGAEAVAATADGLMEGVKEKAEGAEGVSEGGFEAKEKPEDPEPKPVDPPMEKAEAAEMEHVVGTEKLNDDDDDTDDGTGPPAVGTMLNGALEEEAVGAGGVEVAADVRPRFGNVAGADVLKAAILGGCVSKEPANRKELAFISPIIAIIANSTTSKWNSLGVIYE